MSLPLLEEVNPSSEHAEVQVPRLAREVGEGPVEGRLQVAEGEGMG
jgi:hypothetical protein